MLHSETITILGLIAATLSTASLLPQLLRSVKMRETRDLSLQGYALLACAAFLWMIYGILKFDLPILLSNSISCLLATVLVVLKRKYH